MQFGSPKSFLLTTAMAILLCLCVGCTHAADYSHALRAQSNTQGQPVMLAAYQPWFGEQGHISVGYSSQDRTVLEQQISSAKQLGISGFVVNWYGKDHPFEDNSYALMQQIADNDPEGFKVALMYDENDSDPAHATEAVICRLELCLQAVYRALFAGAQPAYLRYNGQPVIFIFPKDGNTDWGRVREVVNGWDERPLLIYKDPNAKWAGAFDGFYAWVQPGKAGWKRDGSNWGQQYLDSFYSTMTHNYPQKIRGGRCLAGVRRQTRLLEPQPAHGRALRPNPGGFVADVPPLLRLQRPLPT